MHEESTSEGVPLTKAQLEIAGSLEEFTPPETVALSFSRYSSEECHYGHQLLQLRDPQQTNVIYVAIQKTPDEVLQQWRSHSNGPAHRITIIDVGGLPRSKDDMTTMVTRDPASTKEVYIHQTSSYTDLTKLGMQLTRVLNRIEDKSGKIAACWGSLSPFLEGNDLDRVYQCLHVLFGQLSRAGCLTHFHIHPEKHDPKTLDTFRSLATSEITVQPDEGIAIIRDYDRSRGDFQFTKEVSLSADDNDDREDGGVASQIG